MTNLDLLRSIGTVMRFNKDEIVIREDDFGDNMYIVLQGKFGVYVNSFVDFPVSVASVEQGSFFGEMSIIDGWPRSATVLAEEDGAVLAISNDKFELLLEKSPDIADSILNVLRSRAESTDEAAHANGKYVPALPTLSDAGDVKSKIKLMTSLAQHIRLTNSLLYEPPAPPKGTIKLLPDGYRLTGKGDINLNSDMLHERKVTCPYCQMKYEAYVPVISNLVQLQTNMDGRIFYKDFNILLYTNIICPNCNYTDSYREFCKYRQVPEKPLYSDNQFKNTEHFTGYSNPINHTVDEAILSYYLNIACLKRITTDPLRFAKSWIRLHWIYSDLNEKTYSIQAARHALDLYDEYLSKNSTSIRDHDQIRLNAIMGELAVATEDYKLAQRYFEANVRFKNVPAAARELAEESLARYKSLKDLIKA